MREAIEIQNSVPIKWETRDDMYSILPKDGYGIEIGVRRGLNARVLYNVTKPKRMFLIDPWRGELKHWKPNGARKTQHEWDKNCEITTAEFQGEIDEGRVKIIRTDATDARDVFPLESIDWIYVDGNHMFAHAFADLYYYYRRLKVGGYLMAHDFCDEVSNGNVVLAVDLLRRIYPGIEIVGRTNDKCSTVVMRVYEKEELHWF